MSGGGSREFFLKVHRKCLINSSKGTSKTKVSQIPWHIIFQGMAEILARKPSGLIHYDNYRVGRLTWWQRKMCENQSLASIMGDGIK